MSEEKKCIKNKELCEGVTELSMEDLEQVTGGTGKAKVAYLADAATMVMDEAADQQVSRLADASTVASILG